MAQVLVLDAAIRDWVLIPLAVVMMVLIGFLGYVISNLTDSSESSSDNSKIVKTYMAPQFVVRARNLRAKSFRANEVTTPLLKFMTEFVLHKSLRLTFDSLSPNGLLLVGEVSNLTVAYGSRILLLSNCGDMYTFKYKGIGILLSILSRVLAGNYVNFGVFGLYGGRALSDALDTVLKLIISIPLVGILTYRKVVATRDIMPPP